MSIRVLSGGFQTTVQDMGRSGYNIVGLSPSGAADPAALALGNLLLGNEPGAAALELTSIGGNYFFEKNAVVSLTGAPVSAALDGRHILNFQSVPVQRGQTLEIGSTLEGARSYLCVAGGIQTKPWLGSQSTHLAIACGGFNGRPLKEGDVIPFGNANAPVASGFADPALIESLKGNRIAVVEGMHVEMFPRDSVNSFFENQFTVADECNRVGIRLKGPKMTSSGKELTSVGAPLGVIQVPPGGNPMILFVESQTTGGYPQIAAFASSEQSKVAQLKPGDRITFEKISAGEAEKRYKALWNSILSKEWLHV